MIYTETWFQTICPSLSGAPFESKWVLLGICSVKTTTPSDTQKTWPTPVLQHNCKVAGFHGTLRYVPRVGVPDGCRGHQMPGAGPLVAHLWLPVTSYPSQRQEAHRPEKSCPPSALVHKGRLGLWAGLVSALPNFTRLHVTDSSTVISFYRDYDD